MNLADLESKGAFVDAAPVPKKVTWKRVGKDGAPLEDTFTIHVVRQSFGVMESVLSGEEDKSRASKYLSNSVRLGKDGEEMLTYEQAYRLDEGLAGAFLKAVNEVNAVGRTELKNSQPPTSSGTSLS